MKTETRIRKLAANRIRIKITRRKRGRFFLKMPDGSYHGPMSTKNWAMNNLLSELRCRSVETYEIVHIPKGESK